MSDETPFRIALLIVIGLNMPIAAYHRWQAAKSGERLARREEGLWLMVTLRLAGLLYWIGLFTWLIHPPAMAWTALPLPAWLRWTGAALGTITPLLLYWTMSNLGKNLTDTVVTRTEHTLVTSGPYRWVRHPFYVCVAMLLTAITLLAANALSGLLGLLALVLLAFRTPIEERKLVERFGEEYQSYMQRTPRFVPRFR